MQLNIGTKISELRRNRGCTQYTLAGALGVTAQAVSRWESGGSYPDMEMIPEIASYFGISIDELFGYNNEREMKINGLAARINEMNRQNNGEDVNIDECISLARGALIEFPGNEKLMLSLASVLYNAGYVRGGEHHLTDEDGYDILDTERHRGYAEWREAISLYEKLIPSMVEGDERQTAVFYLAQLYLNVGEHTRALKLVETVPSMYCSMELLKTKATDGRERAAAYSEALIKTVTITSELMLSGVTVSGRNMSAAEKAESLRGAVEIFGKVFTDGNCGVHHAYIARAYTLLSLYLWLDGRRDEAFAALDDSYEQFQLFEKFCETGGAYKSPLVRLADEKVEDVRPHSAMSLAEDWPWWCVPESGMVKREMEADSRWKCWLDKLK